MKFKLYAMILVGALAVGAVLGASLVPGDALADRNDGVWLASSVKVYQVQLNTLTDGGCSISAWATYAHSSDGGTVAEGLDKPGVELGGANQTTCLDIMTRAAVLFKNDKSL